MLHLLYIFAFTLIAFLAISNLIRSLITISTETGPRYASARNTVNREEAGFSFYRQRGVPHPELLDGNGRPIDEPLLVMRSVSVEDARQQLDAIYKASPSQSQEEEDF